MLNDIGFESLPQETYVFVARKGERLMLIGIYVDDMILASNDNVWMENVKKQLGSTFEMKDIGKISTCLGIEFSRDDENRVYLSQKSYTDKVLERFGMSECQPAITPIDVNVKLVKP